MLKEAITPKVDNKTKTFPHLDLVDHVLVEVLVTLVNGISNSTAIGDRLGL